MTKKIVVTGVGASSPLGGTAPESAMDVAIAGLTSCPLTTEFNVPLATIRLLMSIKYASMVAVIPGSGCSASPKL